MRTLMLTAAALAAPSLASSAPSDLTSGLEREVRETRQLSRDIRSGTRAATATAPGLKTNLTIGFAHDKDQDDVKSGTTPFDLSVAATGENWWKFDLKGDGYTRIQTPGEDSASGLSDLKAEAMHPIVEGLRWGVGIKIPVGGNVGSKTSGQTGKLLWAPNASGAWSFAAAAIVSRANGEMKPGVSRIAKVAYGQIAYDLQNGMGVVGSLSRMHRSGIGSATDAGLELDFTPSPNIDGAASVSRGLTSGSRHTGIEVDFTFHF